jgi:GTPase SAR1 family protein
MATFDNSATNQNYQHLYKSTQKFSITLIIVILVGDAGVGKTHIVHR